MAEHSYYDFSCVCGKKVVSEAGEGVCPSCNQAYKVEWPAEYKLQRYNVNGHWRFLSANEIERRIEERKQASIAKERLRYQREVEKREARKLA